MTTTDTRIYETAIGTFQVCTKRWAILGGGERTTKYVEFVRGPSRPAIDASDLREASADLLKIADDLEARK